MAGPIQDSSAYGEESSSISEINVTPFVDVVLVLLVIFMVTAPMLIRDAIQVKLPQAGSVDKAVAQTLGVVVTKEGQILLHGKPATSESITEEVKKTVAGSPDAQAVIAADADARHGDVVRAIDLIKSAGLTRFAIQIQKQN